MKMSIHPASLKRWKDSPRHFEWDPTPEDIRQAERNHGQSLQRLNERGGLAWAELAAVLGHRPYHRMDVTEEAIATWCRAEVEGRATFAAAGIGQTTA